MTLQYFTYFIDNNNSWDKGILNSKTLYNLCATNVSEQQNVMTIFKWHHKTEINLNFKCKFTESYIGFFCWKNDPRQFLIIATRGVNEDEQLICSGTVIQLLQWEAANIPKHPHK